MSLWQLRASRLNLAQARRSCFLLSCATMAMVFSSAMVRVLFLMVSPFSCSMFLVPVTVSHGLVTVAFHLATAHIARSTLEKKFTRLLHGPWEPRNNESISVSRFG